MSFTQITPVPPRLNRSELAVPANQSRMVDKAADSDADIVFLDLEDAVSPDQKSGARQNVIAAINEKEWKNKSVSYRVNGLDTHYMYRDLIDVVEACGSKLDLVMIPKVGCAADIYAVDMLLTQIEASQGFKDRIGIEALIESAMGLQNITEIAKASPRLESLHFGAGDYSASIHAQTTHIGGTNENYAVLSSADDTGHRRTYLGDHHHHALSAIVVAARANGLRPVDSAYGDFSDQDGYIASAKRAAALGCEGKWAIHPSQITLANSIMGPVVEEVEHAQKILKAMEEAAVEGRGAVTFEGRMIDAANIRQAQMLVKKAELLKARN
jgi:malyl-CoA/(S)-citramalyl-CoA lyase